MVRKVVSDRVEDPAEVGASLRGGKSRGLEAGGVELQVAGGGARGR